MTGMVADVQRFSLHDGPGVRTTVFLKGCNLHCPWCHNPETWSPKPQIMFFADKCVRCGRCDEGCATGARVICGTEYTPEALFQRVRRDQPFYGPDGGLTLSGGEVLLQAPFAAALLRLCREAGIGTCVDTALCVPYGQWQELLALNDLFLVDVKTLDAEKARTVLGADITLLRENLRLLSDAGKQIWIRVPCVAGWNDSSADADALAELLNSLQGIQKVDILPIFHHGKRKDSALGRHPAPHWFPQNPDTTAAAFASLLHCRTPIPVQAIDQGD